MQTYIVFIAVVASLALYIFGLGVRQRRLRTSAEDYFTAKNSVGSGEFAAAQTAYALQMATIYPFFTFALTGQWWIAIVNTIFYAIGILIYNLALGRFAGGSLALLGQPKTVHDAIASANNMPWLRAFTSCFTIFAFLGLATFELVWGARALHVLIGSSDLTYYLSLLTLMVYLITYVWFGGQSASIKADQFQLVLSYLGLHALVIWVALRPEVNFQNLALPALVPIIAAASILMFLYRVFTINWKNISRTNIILNVITLASITAMTVVICRHVSELGRDAVSISNSNSILVAMRSPGSWIILASVATLPIFFQFVDMTNWQRLRAISAARENRLGDSLRGLTQYLIESPLSWLLPIFIGLACAQFLATPAGKDPWEFLLNAVLSDQSAGGLLVAIFVFMGVVAIFLSTATELLSGIGYAAAYDLIKYSRLRADRIEKREVIGELSHLDVVLTTDDTVVKSVGRWAFTIGTVITVALVILADLVTPNGDLFLIGLFLSMYTPLIALAPSLLVPILFGRRARPAFVVGSLCGGSLLGLGLGVLSAFEPGALGGLIIWLPAPVSFGCAWLLYVAGLPGGSRLAAGSATQ